MSTRRIPLFPLNVVLFPGMALPLHIFEPRYQEMVRRCLDADRLFGVCLIRSGEEVGEAADPFAVGTTCEILSATPLGEGRLKLTTIGRDRFRILRLDQELPYLEAEIELISEQSAGDLDDLVSLVQAAAKEYVRALLALNGETAGAIQLPQDPVRLSNLVGAALQVPLRLRQELLEESRPQLRLERQLELLNRELEQLRRLDETESPVARPYQFDRGRISLN